MDKKLPLYQFTDSLLTFSCKNYLLNRKKGWVIFDIQLHNSLTKTININLSVYHFQSRTDSLRFRIFMPFFFACGQMVGTKVVGPRAVAGHKGRKIHSFRKPSSLITSFRGSWRFLGVENSRVILGNTKGSNRFCSDAAFSKQFKTAQQDIPKK